MTDLEPVAPETRRPRSPDGFKQKFDCCHSPDVWEYEDGGSRCRTCGHVWTDELN